MLNLFCNKYWNASTTLTLYSPRCTCLIKSSYFQYWPILLCCLCHRSVNFQENGQTNRHVLYSCSHHFFLLATCVCIDVCVSFPKGERLRIPANKCCPECISSSQGSCQYEGVVYGVSENDKGSVLPLHPIIQPFYRTLTCTHKDAASVGCTFLFHHARRKNWTWEELGSSHISMCGVKYFELFKNSFG